ncbi:MAG: 3-isopropylmalate dehydratase small subunit [Frankiales bacterium]|nr:MAG: 3-isopropylmalate dehydratase small subunit [Frankiales bacterium]
MEPFTTHTGRAVALRRSDVDTDQIIPSDWLKRVERTGFGAGLFSQWREDPGFVLNLPQHAGASILVAGKNFGTGSSREHAVWALTDFGFRAVVSERFADIFRSNALKGGLLPVQLTAAAVAALMDRLERDPDLAVTVDLDRRELRAGDLVEAFPLDDFTRWRLMEGLDDIGLTLRAEDEIASYEATRPEHLPTATSPGP